MSCEDPQLVRTAVDKVPIFGWFSLRRHVNELGSGFWIRPVLIEIVWAIGLPWFWFWQATPGLTDGVAVSNLWIETWFWGHSVLIALMFIATFIDFDEKTIPDEITLSGTFFALVMAAAAPWFRLPELVNNMSGASVQPIHYGSSNVLPTWHLGAIGHRSGIADCPSLVSLAAAGPLHIAIRFDTRHRHHRGQHFASQTQVRLLVAFDTSTAIGTNSIVGDHVGERFRAGLAGLAIIANTQLDQPVWGDHRTRFWWRHGVGNSHCRQLRDAAGSDGLW